MRVLVVDDAPDIRLLLRFALGPHGYQVEEAGSGVEALELLANELPDAVILDIQMPMMDGLETLRSLRSSERTAHVPVVLCSVKAREEDLAEGRRLGCDGYVTKPFDIDDLLTVLRAAIDRRADGNAEHRVS